MSSLSGAERARVLGHPLAYLVTVAILLAAFGATFVANPERVAPTRDPAYYTWRTEVFVSEPPVRLVELEGALDMFAGGYRIAAPLLGGYLRQIPGISPLNTTVVLMVLLPVAIATLLGGFAYRHRRDPLAFHVVALGSGSLLLTPPFVGYLDNVLALFFLAAALFFIGPARTSWAARVAFGMLLAMGGLTHPTTLAIFGLTLAAMAGIRLIGRRFAWRSVIEDDGPLLATAATAAIVVLAIWTVGIWGRSAALGEAALPPPYGSDFFLDRMLLWIDAMNPYLNAPVFLLAAIVLMAAGRRWVEDDLARVAIVWLAPLIGLFGFVAAAYPYYRFFNTTLAWVLLVGLGMYFAVAFFLDRAARGGIATLSLVGVVAVAAIIAANFGTGYRTSHWNDPAGGWLSAEERRDLGALRSALLATTDRDRPVVFVIDDEPRRPFQIWGFTKLAGNTSRFGMPPEQIDRSYVYLGDLENYLAGEPTTRGEATYDRLSEALLRYAADGIEREAQDPVVAVAAIFNRSGANVDVVESEVAPDADGEVWVVRDGEVVGPSSTLASDRAEAGVLHLGRVLVGLGLLLIPGLFALRLFLPGATLPEALGLVPALAAAVLVTVGMLVAAVLGSPFTVGPAWLSLLAAATALAVLTAMRREPSS